MTCLLCENASSFQISPKHYFISQGVTSEGVVGYNNATWIMLHVHVPTEDASILLSILNQELLFCAMHHTHSDFALAIILP